MSSMSDRDLLIAEIISNMESLHEQWRPTWQDIALNALTEQADFDRTVPQKTKMPSTGQRSKFIYDPTAQNSLNKSASILISIVTPTGTNWHTIQTRDHFQLTSDEKLQMKEQMDKISDTISVRRYASHSNFRVAH